MTEPSPPISISKVSPWGPSTLFGRPRQGQVAGATEVSAKDNAGHTPAGVWSSHPDEKVKKVGKIAVGVAAVLGLTTIGLLSNSIWLSDTQMLSQMNTLARQAPVTQSYSSSQPVEPITGLRGNPRAVCSPAQSMKGGSAQFDSCGPNGDCIQNLDLENQSWTCQCKNGWFGRNCHQPPEFLSLSLIPLLEDGDARQAADSLQPPQVEMASTAADSPPNPAADKGPLVVPGRTNPITLSFNFRAHTTGRVRVEFFWRTPAPGEHFDPIVLEPNVALPEGPRPPYRLTVEVPDWASFGASDSAFFRISMLTGGDQSRGNDPITVWRGAAQTPTFTIPSGYSWAPSLAKIVQGPEGADSCAGPCSKRAGSEADEFLCPVPCGEGYSQYRPQECFEATLVKDEELDTKDLMSKNGTSPRTVLVNGTLLKIGEPVPEEKCIGLSRPDPEPIPSSRCTHPTFAECRYAWTTGKIMQRQFYGADREIATEPICSIRCRANVDQPLGTMRWAIPPVCQNLNQVTERVADLGNPDWFCDPARYPSLACGHEICPGTPYPSL